MYKRQRQIWNKAQYVCPNCGVHLPIGGYYRLNLILDKGSFRELDADLAPQDVLQFPGYPEKMEAQTGKTGLKEAVITATGPVSYTHLDVYKRQPSMRQCSTARPASPVVAR